MTSQTVFGRVTYKCDFADQPAFGIIMRELFKSRLGRGRSYLNKMDRVKFRSTCEAVDMWARKVEDPSVWDKQDQREYEQWLHEDIAYYRAMEDSEKLMEFTDC